MNETKSDIAKEFLNQSARKFRISSCADSTPEGNDCRKVERLSRLCEKMRLWSLKYWVSGAGADELTFAKPTTRD